jgi:VWFA-related protein
VTTLVAQAIALCRLRLLQPLLVAAFCTSLAWGQTSFPSQQSTAPLFPAAADAAQVDALVTDPQGLPVPDLTAADFEILRNNQPQKILSAAYVRTERTVLLVVDDLGLSLDAINTVRAALARFVDQQMRPGDRAAIVRTGAGSGALQAFTTAKDRLHAAIDQVKCHPVRIAGNPDAASRNEFSAGSRAALRFAVDGLRQLPGRKAVVVLSGNLAMFRDAAESAVRLVDSANQAGAVLYGGDPNAAADPISAASFMVLAEQTGGAVIAPGTDLASALDRVLREQDGYYLLDFHPSASLTPLAEKLTVRVNRESLQVRSRTGPLVKPGNAPDSSQTSRRQQILRAIADPFSSSDIRVRLTTIFTSSAQGSQIETLSYIDPGDLGFIHFLNGVHRYGLDVLVLVCTEDGRIVHENSRSLYVDMSATDYRHAAANGLVFALNVPVRLPGPYQIRVLVGDGITGKIGFAYQFLDAPDANGKQVSLSSILLMGEKSINPLSRPPGIQPDLTPESAAVRVFHPGGKVVYGFEVLNPVVGSDNKPALETQSKLFRNGQVIFEGTPSPLAIPTGEDPKHHYVAGTVTLSSSIEPGDYVFYVTVVDKLAAGPSRKVAQAIDFRVQP